MGRAGFEMDIDSEERDDDEVLLLQLEDCDYSTSDNQGFSDVAQPEFRQDLRSTHRDMLLCPADDKTATYPSAYRQPPAHIQWPQSDGYAIDIKMFETSDSDREDSSDSEANLYFSSAIPQQKSLAAGDDCLCLDSRDGQQWLATIKKKTGLHALVHYKGWSKSCDDWVSLSSISPKPSQAVLERLKIYNSCNNKNFNSNVRSDSKKHLASLSNADDQDEISRHDYRGVEPVYSNRNQRNVTGWNAVAWNGHAKRTLSCSPCNSSTEAAKAWDLASKGQSKIDSEVINFPEKSQFARNPKVPLGSRVFLSRKGVQEGGVLTAFFGKGKYQISRDEGDFSTVSIPSSIVSVVSRPPGKSDIGSPSDGPNGAMLKMQAACEQYPANTIIGSLGLAVGGIRALWRRCRRSGVLLYRSTLHSKNSLAVLKPLSHALIALSSLRSGPGSSDGCAEDVRKIDYRAKHALKSVRNKSEKNFPRKFPALKKRLENRGRIVTFKNSSSRSFEAKADELDSSRSSRKAALETDRDTVSKIDGILNNGDEGKVQIRSPGADSSRSCEHEGDKAENHDSGKFAHSSGCTSIIDLELLCDVAKSSSNSDALHLRDESSKNETGDVLSSDTVRDVERFRFHDKAGLGASVESVTSEGPCSTISFIQTTDAGVQRIGTLLPSAPSEEPSKGSTSSQESASASELQVSHCQAIIQSAEIRDMSEDSLPATSAAESNTIHNSTAGAVQSTIPTTNREPRNDESVGASLCDTIKTRADSPARRNLTRQAALASRKLAERPKSEGNAPVDTPQRRKKRRIVDPATGVIGDDSKAPKQVERVEVYVKGNWWVAVVEQRSHGQVQVRYVNSDGRSSSTREWVMEDRIRPIQGLSELNSGIDEKNLIGVKASDGEAGLQFWTATLTSGKKTIHVGTFTSMIEAVEAYDMAALRNEPGDRVRLNRPHMRSHYFASLQGEIRKMKVNPQETDIRINCVKMEASSRRQPSRNLKEKPTEAAKDPTSSPRFSVCRIAKPHVSTCRRNPSKSRARDEEVLSTGRRGRFAKRDNSMVGGRAFLQPSPEFQSVQSASAAARSAELLSESNPGIPSDTGQGMSSCDGKEGWRNDYASDTPETVSRETIQECPSSLDGMDQELRHMFEPETPNLMECVSAVDLSAAITSRGNSPDPTSRAVQLSEDPSTCCACKQFMDQESPRASNFHIVPRPTLLQSEIMQMEDIAEADGSTLSCTRGAEGKAGPLVSELELDESLDGNEVHRACSNSVIGPCAGDKSHQLESDLLFTSAIMQEH